VANGIEVLVRVVETSVSAQTGTVLNRTVLVTTNRVIEDGEDAGQLVPVETIDRVVGEERPLLVKIDVEGYEPQVIAGAHQVLADPQLQALLIETTDDGIRAYLAGAGFRRATYEPFSRRLEWAKTPEVKDEGANNSLYVRDIEVCRARVASAPRRRVLGQSV
jgi:hypothetical protein